MATQDPAHREETALDTLVPLDSSKPYDIKQVITRVVDDACAHVLLQTSPRDIDTVMVDGEIRMRAGVLAGFEPERAAAMIRASRQRILG